MTGDVCSGVDCNLGTCSSQQDSNGVIAAQCTCNEGAISKNLTYCDTQENLVAETQSENSEYNVV